MDGAIAQLGERLHGMQEVSGSIPLGSTNFPPCEGGEFPAKLVMAKIGGAKRLSAPRDSDLRGAKRAGSPSKSAKRQIQLNSERMTFCS